MKTFLRDQLHVAHLESKCGKTCSSNVSVGVPSTLWLHTDYKTNFFYLNLNKKNTNLLGEKFQVFVHWKFLFSLASIGSRNIIAA